jgi:photosystem II stability/assembly factor-like uncharacterized protein
VTASVQDPSVIYYGTDKLLRTTDRGVTFDEISHDLTRNEKDKQGLNGGPITAENVGAEFYGTILTITASPHAYGTVWVGSDDGLIHVTRDDGESWHDVTPGELGGAMVNSIDVSPHDPGTAYVAVAGYKMNDFRPYIYKLTNYGIDATRLDADLPRDNFIRVVREDPERKGLLYAGGEGGMYVSFDDGANWQSLDLNLPPVPITDLAVRQGDLVAATQGRGFWVLDDLSRLRGITNEMADKPVHLVESGPVEMIRRGWGGRGGSSGTNPARGVVLDYIVRDEHEGPLTIEISDAGGNVVRSYSSEEGDFERCILGNMDQRIPFKVTYPPKKQGANRWVWDMRRDGLHCIEDIRLFEGFAGAYVMPGTYQVRVAIGDEEDTTEVTLVPDRRVEASEAEFAEVERHVSEMTTLMNELLDGLAAVRRSRGQIEALLAAFPEAEGLRTAGESAIERLTAWEEDVVQVEFETYEDEDNLPGKLVKHSRHLLDVIDDAGPPVAAGALERLEDLQAEWAELLTELVEIETSDIKAVNDWALENTVPHVSTRG